MSNQQIASFTFLTIVDDSVHNVCWWQYLWQLPNSKFPHSCRWQLLWVMMITFHTFCKFFSWSSKFWLWWLSVLIVSSFLWGVWGGCGGVGGGVLHYMARKQLAISKIMTQLFHHLAFVLRSIYARTMRCFDVSLFTFSHYIAGPKGFKRNQVLTSEISIFFLFVFQLLLLFIWLFIFRFSNPYIKVIEQ